ncbi:MAG: zinc ribbon domain-containing protein [Lachnospiraceae bacterium]|jgi:ribosomal protein L32|nr:zinc ribbon domain-containing protein [Lachnospiraceae bacterium]
MGFLDKVGDFAKNIGDKANEAIETTKINSKISGEKAALSKELEKIGQFYYERGLAGGDVAPELAPVFQAVADHHAAIASLQEEIKRIEAETAARSVPQPQPQAQPYAAPGGFAPAGGAPAGGGVVCPSCGKENVPGTKFCNECGFNLEEAAARAAADVAEAPQAAPEAQVCPECGATVQAGMKFCGACGYKFS